MIKHGSRNNSPAGRLIDLETGNEVKKTVYISGPFCPGLRESFKQLFRYTHVQDCFKGQNTIKSMFMHPKDKVNPSLKKDVVYQWSCTNPGCKSSYIGETSRSLCKCVKEHSKEGSNSAAPVSTLTTIWCLQGPLGCLAIENLRCFPCGPLVAPI